MSELAVFYRVLTGSLQVFDKLLLYNPHYNNIWGFLEASNTNYSDSPHVESAAKAVNLELSKENSYSEEAYILHKLVGVMAQNIPAAAKESHV